MLKKVESSDWVTPIIPILKPDGRVIICLWLFQNNYIINLYLDVPGYPTPT